MNSAPLLDDPAPHQTLSTRIVGLGASAGGLEALQQFVANVPRASGLAYVVVQHLDPTHKAMLTDLLQRATAMPVREATGSTRVESDVVYVIPPSTELTVIGGRLHLAEPAQPRGRRLPIDVLFCSLARDQGERAVGVVLSGMGSDGTIGLQAIKGQGGLTLAQEPASAQFDSMPKSAIDAGACDIVAPPAELPHRILLVTAKPPVSAPGFAAADPDGEQSLNAILGLLRERSKHDLTLYKTSTVKRRIERRMGVHGLDALAAYERFVRKNPQELDLLFKELLIGVTSFFRDPPVWQEFKDTVLAALLARRAPGTPMRAWVVGCSTGEEAYSLAMVFREVADAQVNPDAWSLQIFATDLSADAIALARKGLFSAKIAADVSPERLGRFFDAQGDGWVICKEIRQMILFAQHDVILDAPFTRLDILSCRNLMIYFVAALQQRLLPLFHYVLRPGGVLVLGGSETVGRSGALFTALDPKSRIYLRSDAVALAGEVDFPVNRRLNLRPPAQESNVSHPLTRLTNLQSLADQVLLQDFAPSAVLVNDQGDVVYISGHTGKYLEPAAGKANWNIHVMARPAIRAQLAAAMGQALQEKKTIELRGLKLADDAQSTLDIIVQPLREPPGLEGMVMIVFRDVAAPAGAKSRRKRTAGTLDPAIGDDLAHAREEIRALRQEMHASQEELQSANEELQSTNE
ncbi:MAG: chemotaxis protein CheB, partial [Steroidobacteraceae bacterium]